MDTVEDLYYEMNLVLTLFLGLFVVVVEVVESCHHLDDLHLNDSLVLTQSYCCYPWKKYIVHYTL